ncbi:MAG: hypothetical protein ABDH37_05565 [Candidatus Hydrothermales bacterium]
MNLFLFSFYFSINLLFPQSKPNEDPGIGREFVFVSKISKVKLYFGYSEIEVSSGTEIFVKNYEVGIFHKFLLNKTFVFSLFPGCVYAIKEKENYREDGFFYSLNFLVTLKKEMFPLLGFKVFWDGETFLNFLKLGLFFEF